MKRIAKLRQLMKERMIDYIILGPGSNMFYLTGFTEEQMERPLFLVIDNWNVYFLAPKLYEEQLSHFNIPVVSYSDDENPYKKLNIEKGKSIAIDDTLWSSFTIDIINNFSPSQLIKANEIMKELRIIKQDEEIEIMKEGVRIAEKSFINTINQIKPGLNEKKIAKMLVDEFLNNGADSVSFEPIVTSGPNTSMPHLRSTIREIKQGDILIFDFGVKYKGYSTDTTRVASIGKPNEEIIKIFEIVKEAQQKAEDMIKENIQACEIDKVARQVISNYGFGKYFIHRTGHGIGIDVHEEPYIAPNYKRKIEKNMVFTIEPGIYLPEKFGIRIEDMVYVNNKAVMMNNLQKEEIFII
ncbi:aminopeptidase P family protein [Sulfolobus sp. S-194]|uniref:M24 family metallopeptidase n=1 Tax=Sulfolobus sp. S-194 TaxID=2512240 RepID=UPI00143711F7|nr:aminopeptidase P family protein [Sulfolobus sp. S-194]QIW25107.1 aminopeptidase P family protein [Sulfolobus sp. S-194]